MKNVIINVSEIDFTNPISFYSKKYGLCYNTMRNRFKKLGIYEKFAFTGGINTSAVRHKLSQEKYEHNPKICFHCRGKIPYEKRMNKFCSLSCSAKYSNSNRILIITDEARNRARKQMMDQQSRGICITAKEKIKKVCQTCNKEFEVRPSEIRRRFCSRKCSDKMDRTGLGGYRYNSGRGKQGWYKGYYCQSSWELAWVLYSLDHGIKFIRNNVGFQYEYEGAIHRYFPDFILEDGSYVEVKGYNSKQWEEKKRQFPHKLLTIGKKEIKLYLSYVIQNYGKDFIRLYETV
jgi:hypothetical protein